ncbi:MAG: hypothetical protein ACRYGR_07740 [Janthinobacterium lividum]
MRKLNVIFAVLILSCISIASASSRLLSMLEEGIVFSKRSVYQVPKRSYHSQMKTPAYKPRGPIRLSENLPETYENLPRKLDAIDNRGELYKVPSSQKQSAPLSLKEIEEINPHTVYVDLKKKK